MKYLRVAISILLLVLLATPIIALAASNISGARYLAQIVVSNNSTATTNVATTANISTANLIAGNYINSSANNTVMRNSSDADVPFMPGYTPDDGLWCMWVPSIGANSLQTYILYTANSTGGELRYFPAAGGMTTPDDTSLELSDNFTVEQKGWVNTDNSVNKNLVLKSGAFRTFVSPYVSENITSQIITGTGASGDGYTAGDDGTSSLVDAVTWIAQTFTPSPGFPVREIRLKLNRGAGATGTLTVKIQGVDGASKPDGTDLITADIDIATRIAVGAAWVTIAEDITDLATGVQYAIVIHSTDIAGGAVNWSMDTSSPTYTGGSNAGSGDSGATWSLQTAYDMMFDIYTYSYVGVTATGVASDNHTVETSLEDSISFNGTGDWIRVLDHDDFSFYSAPAGTDLPFTIIAWVLIDDATSRTLFAKRQTANVIEYAFRLDAADALDIICYRAGTANYIGATGSILTTYEGSWVQLAVTYDGSTANTGFNLYINGIDDPTTPTSGGAYGEGMDNTASDVEIGSLQIGTVAFFDGEMAEVKIYARELTPAQILADYNGEHLSTDLKGWWQMGEGTGNAADSSGGGHTGTLNGASWATGLMKITVDNILEDTADGVAVSDNTSNWAFAENDSFMYLEDQAITIAGAQAQYIEWEYGAVFSDQSVNSNDATPSFRSASSNAYVSANMTAFTPKAEAKAPDYVLGVAPPFIDADALTGNVTGTFTTTPATSAGFPLAGVIISIANATGTPAQLPLLIIAVFVILAASLSMSAVMRQHGSGTLIVKIITIVAISGIFIALKNFGIDFWMLIVFLVIAVALSMASRHVSWQ